MRKTSRVTNRVYWVTWSYKGGVWQTVRAYADNKAQAKRAAKNQFGNDIVIHDVELCEE